MKDMKYLLYLILQERKKIACGIYRLEKNKLYEESVGQIQTL